MSGEEEHLKMTRPATKPASSMFSSLPPPSYSQAMVVTTKPVTANCAISKKTNKGHKDQLFSNKPSQPSALLLRPKFPIESMPHTFLAVSLHLKNKVISF